MSTIDVTRTVAELAETYPGAPRVFERLGIDYCCGGKRPLDRACRDLGVPLARAQALLEEAAIGKPVHERPSAAPALIEHILAHHHAFTRSELERLVPLAAKVLRAHGERHPVLSEVAALLHALRADLLPHMAKEERVLFPYILQLAAGHRTEPPFVSIASPLRVMHSEHEEVGALLEKLAIRTDRYTSPSFACASFRALYAGLAELQADLHEHIHLENNLLFPLAEQLEAERLA